MIDSLRKRVQRLEAAPPPPVVPKIKHLLSGLEECRRRGGGNLPAEIERIAGRIEELLGAEDPVSAVRDLLPAADCRAMHDFLIKKPWKPEENEGKTA